MQSEKFGLSIIIENKNSRYFHPLLCAGANKRIFFNVGLKKRGEATLMVS